AEMEGTRAEAVVLPMLALAMLGLLAGAILGLRFKVQILVPAIMLTTVAVTIGGLFIEVSFGTIAISVLLSAIALQIGYFCPALIRLRPGAADVAQRAKTESVARTAHS